MPELQGGNSKQQGLHNHADQELVQKENKQAVDRETGSDVPSTVNPLEPAARKDVKNREENEDPGGTKRFFSLRSVILNITTHV